MSKGEGRKIAIKFTQPLLGDVSGNTPAFSVTGKEYKYVNGPLLDKTFTVDSVERAPAGLFYQEAFNGVSDGVEVGDGLSLGSEAGGIGAEDRLDTNTTSGGSYEWAEQRIEAKENKTIVAVTCRSRSTGTHTLSFRDWANNEIASAQASGVASGEWYTFALNISVNIVASQQYRIYITRPSTTIYRESSLYNGTIWKSLGWQASAGTWDETIAMGLIEIGEERRELGTYITPQIPTTTLSAQVRLKTQATTPPNTSIKIEYGFGATTPTVWTLATDLIPIGTDPLWLKYTLETTDTAVTPTLSAVWLEAPEAPQDIIRLNVNEFTRIHNAEGQVTVGYNANIGSLVGEGGAVASFTNLFTPTDLAPEPNPHEQETVNAVISNVTFNYDLVSYIDAESTEQNTVVVHPATVTVDYTKIDIEIP